MKSIEKYFDVNKINVYLIVRLLEWGDFVQSLFFALVYMLSHILTQIHSKITLFNLT